MDAKYIVFMDGLKGMQWMPAMGGDVLEGVVQNIQEGCLGCGMPSQQWMYYIYTRHQMNVPLHGTKYDTYMYCSAVAGSHVEKPRIRNMQYALSHQSSMAWFFTDDIFGDYQ
jgi:hypothetical protein